MSLRSPIEQLWLEAGGPVPGNPYALLIDEPDPFCPWADPSWRPGENQPNGKAD